MLQTSKDQQKCASALHFRPKDFSLQAYVRANFAERNEIARAEKARRTRPNSDEAGATPPFDAPCVTASVGSLPPQSRAARDPFSRVPEPEFRSCKTTSITPRKGERKDTDQSTRKTTQDGNIPRFMMSRASNASRTGMPNSVVILVSLPVAPSWLRKILEKNKLSD